MQSNFGRTGELFAFETYGLEPDIVVLGKGLGNGVPVAAAVGRSDLFGALEYGEGSDTWSANPLCCAAVLATLDEFAAATCSARCGQASAIIEAGLVGLKELPFVAACARRKGRHGLGRRDAGSRRPVGGGVGERVRARLLPRRRQAATASTCSGRWRRRWSASPRR